MIKLRNKTKLILSFVGLIILLIYSSYAILYNLQFLILPTQTVQGKQTSYNLSRFVTSVNYSYQVNNSLYTGKSIKSFFSGKEDISSTYNIKYLISKNSISTISEFILWNIIAACIVFFPLMLGGVFLCLGLLKKLPVKIQGRFNNYININPTDV